MARPLCLIKYIPREISDANGFSPFSRLANHPGRSRSFTSLNDVSAVKILSSYSQIKTAKDDITYVSRNIEKDRMDRVLHDHILPDNDPRYQI